MSAWVLYVSYLVAIAGAGMVVFLFSVTRGALIFRNWGGPTRKECAHIYPVFSSAKLIKLVDFQPLISAILLFQYPRLVSAIVNKMKGCALAGKTVMMTSCAFGNVMPRVVKAAIGAQAERVVITDMIKNELDHAETKLTAFASKLEYRQENAVASSMPDRSVAANIIFFLLHELPTELQRTVLTEAARVVAPGGTLYLAEFHRPTIWPLRVLSWIYFKVFEPFGLALWGENEPARLINDLGGFTCIKKTFLFGNFQVIMATRNAD